MMLRRISFLSIFFVSSIAWSAPGLSERIEECRKLDDVKAQECIIAIDDESEASNRLARLALLGTMEKALQEQPQTVCKDEYSALLRSTQNKGRLKSHIQVAVDYYGCLALVRETQTAILEQAERDFAPRFIEKR